jgi:hypothetical protein
MNDEELEARLRRFRAAAPRPDLRDQVLAAVDAAAVAGPRAIAWGAAAAALLVIAMGLQWARMEAIRAVALRSGENPATHVADTLAEAMGGTATARFLAHLQVARQLAESEKSVMPGRRGETLP